MHCDPRSLLHKCFNNEPPKISILGQQCPPVTTEAGMNDFMTCSSLTLVRGHLFVNVGQFLFWKLIQFMHYAIITKAHIIIRTSCVGCKETEIAVASRLYSSDRKKVNFEKE